MAVSSLYEGLEVETKRPPLAGGDSSDIGWFHDDTSRMKFMSSQLQRTKILKDRLYNQQNLPKPEQQLYPEDELPPPIHDTVKSPLDPPSASPMDTEIPLVTDTYNPMRPNSYEDFARDRAIRREIQRLERMKLEEEERKRRQYEDKKRRHRRRSSSSSGSDGERRKRGGHRGERAAIPPPPDLSGQTTEKSEGTNLDLSNSSTGPLAPKGLSVAANIMSKYGWKEGMGLGKESQGMSRALVVEKTSRRGGKILPSTGNNSIDQEKSAQVLSHLKNPSKVLLLQNMVVRGQVDAELNEEVSEECAKYGEVAKVVIFEIPEGVPDEESVRIFVEFARNESTIKAYVDLNGRYFGGRVVKGSFFDEERFANMDLGPIPLA